MYCLSRFCCLCLCDKTKLKLLSEINRYDTSFANLASSVIPELEFLDLGRSLSVCEPCAESLTEMHAFRQSCVEKNRLLVEYVRRLRRNGRAFGHVRVEMIDVGKRNACAETGCAFERVKVEDDVPASDGADAPDEPSAFEAANEGTVRVKIEEPFGRSENVFIDAGSPREPSGRLARSDFPVDPLHVELPASWRFTTEKKHKCDTCGKAFVCLSKLKVHEMIHTGERPFKCDACDKSFQNLNKLNIHRVVHTGERPYKCDICGKSFTQKNNLYSHGVIHSGERPYKCDVCGKAFNRSNWLKTHVFVHTGEKPHKCEVCERPFSCVKNLKRHVKTHSVREPYRCDACGKTYSYFSELQRHARTHREDAGGKPFKCEICEKVFSHSCNLKRHRFIHTGEKPHKCDVCGKCFSLVWDLKRHTITHSRGKNVS